MYVPFLITRCDIVVPLLYAVRTGATRLSTSVRSIDWYPVAGTVDHITETKDVYEMVAFRLVGCDAETVVDDPTISRRTLKRNKGNGVYHKHYIVLCHS